MPQRRDNFQSLCDELIQMGDIMTCAATSSEGRLLGASYGTLPVPESLRERNAESVGQILRAFAQGTELGGPLEFITAGYKNFVLLLIPIQGTNACVSLVVAHGTDLPRMRQRIKDLMAYWLRANGYMSSKDP